LLDGIDNGAALAPPAKAPPVNAAVLRRKFLRVLLDMGPPPL
jgi:hypothetical protein